MASSVRRRRRISAGTGEGARTDMLQRSRREGQNQGDKNMVRREREGGVREDEG